MVRCVCAVDELPSAIASTAQSSYAVNSGVLKMLTTRRRFAVMSWTHTQIKLKLVTVLEIILLPVGSWLVDFKTPEIPPMATKLVLPLSTQCFFF